MSKKKLARAIGVCGIAIMIIVVITILPSCESSPTPPTYGLEFDGEDDYVDVGTMGYFGSNISEGTISFWLKTTRTERQDAFLLVSGEAATSFGVTFNQFNVDEIRFIIRDEAGKRLDARVPVANILDGNWHFIEVYYKCSTNTVTISADGVPQSVTYEYQETPATFVNFQYPLLLGTMNGPGGIKYYFQGTLSEIKIDNGGVGGYWRFDEGSGIIAHDSTANNNSGTLEGGPVWFGGGG